MLSRQSSRDGRAFIERYICLGVPIAIWVYGSYAAVAYASAAIFRPPSTGDVATYPLALGAALTLLGFVALAIYFIVLQRFLRQVSDLPAI